MPFIPGLAAGGFGGYGSYVGWLADMGIQSGSIGWAVTVGIILFLIGVVFGVAVFIGPA